MGRSPCCSKDADLNRGAWTAKEDMILKEYVRIHGDTSWRSVPKNAGLKRCGKSCRLRWLNYLRPDIKRGNISSDEEELIIRLHGLLGNRWSLIAGRLPGRTDNEIKNYWNTHLGKKMQSQKKTLVKLERKEKPSPPTDDGKFKVTPVKATAVRAPKVCSKYVDSGYSNQSTEPVQTVKSSRTWTELLQEDFITDYNSDLMDSTMATESGSPFPEISGQYSPDDFRIDELQGSPGNFMQMSSLYNSLGQGENFTDDDWVHELKNLPMSSLLLSESQGDDFTQLSE
ncbi:hypothetical protein SUGI_1002970 [Cryptomeria japonica]|uniref:transcription factor MYB1 n=1 Tax=Cryptomeria japonica TaxID=3369 RepID=UPI002414C908|nr:transcription factor MYB1 [Cryptomeria japonica]GLJ47506.1 hypothetical protein SUGI_1002970 [Cryptomeria japonica]